MPEDEVLEQVWPDEAERRRSREQFKEIQRFIEDEFDRQAELMGSLAKGTFLAGDKDLDIFVFFDADTSGEILEEDGLAIGEAVFDRFDGTYEVEFAEHPYTKGEIDGFEVEIVPAYDIDSPAELKSSVDRTPLHTEWVNNALSTEEKREVVLLKAFLKGRGLYGSSLRVEGFSGYLCELLIAEYGGFRSLLKAAVDWERETVIDVADHHDGLPEELAEKFADEDLVVIDPTDPERNVASVLSSENYARFIYEAWRYLQEPSLDAFFPEEPVVDPDRLEEELDAHGTFVVLELDRPDVVDDILYPQLRRLMRRLRQEMVGRGFELFDSGFHVTEDRVRLVFDPLVEELPDRVKHHGPAVFHNEEHLQQFTEAYDRVWVEDDRLVTVVEREHTTPREVLAAFLDGDLPEQGVPGNLVEPMQDASFVDVRPGGEDWDRFLWSFLHLEGNV
ncbi:MAG: CCA tRNA nucleotidyltransferase [Candidatus Nanohaloarchaea archaeon]|nr:CCA tRNA nucleotidyltransferase [Candidatus Nanohaloarchaea archaeon]